MINQPKENDMKDLDMSDVIADGERMREEQQEREMERLTSHHDPIPLIDVCAMICDREGGDVDDFMRSSILQDLIQGSQSNPNGVEDEIRKALTLLFN